MHHIRNSAQFTHWTVKENIVDSDTVASYK